MLGLENEGSTEIKDKDRLQLLENAFVPNMNVVSKRINNDFQIKIFPRYVY